jgi:hypothetical protein
MEEPLNRKLASSAVAVTLTLVSPVMMASSADAARCVSGAEVRGQVAAFVHSLRDDVANSSTRGHVRAALNDSVKTARGAKADTPKENRGLGKEISALARQKKDAEDRLARAAINAQIHALQEQKRADHLSDRDVKELEKDVKRLEKRLVAKTDSHGEGREISASVHAIMAQFNC